MALFYDTKNQSFRQIMGNGLKYNVPRFQRDYSWDQEQWYDLWLDVCGLQTETEPHYMGCLVFESADNKNFTIIDGQQRLATVSILILAGLSRLRDMIERNIEKENNNKRLKALRGSFIGFTDPISLQLKNKITLNRNNELYFSSYLCGLKPAPKRNIKASERLMARAFDYFKKQFESGETASVKEGKGRSAPEADCNKNVSSVKEGEGIARFIETMADRLIFTSITVGDETNAYTIFETLNARGVYFSTPDLVKNYIFSMMAGGESGRGYHEKELDRLEDRWSEITRQLGRYKFSDFIRADWNAGYLFARKIDLFKKIKSEINNPEKADKYLDRLRENSEIYAALKDPDDEFWKRHNDGEYNQKGLTDALKTLNLFHITNAQSALTAAFHKLPSDKFVRFLSYVEAVSIRYNVIGNQLPGPQERVYSKLARAISGSAGISLSKIRDILREIYPDDEVFLQSFKKKSFKTKKTEKQVRYLLARIENRLTGGSVNEALLTVEHILPRNPAPEWNKLFDGGDAEIYADFIGNMTLLSERENKDAGSAGFDKKKERYDKSPLQITKKISDYLSWDKDAVLSRQEWLGEQAVDLWRIPSD